MEKRFLRLVAAVLALVLCAAAAASVSAASINVTLTLSQKYCAVTVGKTYKLEAKTDTGAAVEWSSSDTSVVRVSGGVLTGVKAGSASVTAKCGTASATCSVTVTPEVSKEFGIDVSSWQGVIDWAKLKASGVKFAIIRLGYGTDEATTPITIDKYWAKNVEGAKKNGIEIGVYLYSYAPDVASAKNEARQVVAELGKYTRTFTYPIWFDIENSSCTANSKQTNVNIVKAFCDTVEAAGYYAGFYTYQYYLATCLDRAALSKYDLWLANYGPNDGKPHELSYEGAYGMWQYTSTGLGMVKAGSVEGTGLDLDLAYKDYKKTIINAGLNGFGGSVSSNGTLTVPDPEPEPERHISIDFSKTDSAADYFFTGPYTVKNGVLTDGKGFVLQSRCEGVPPVGYAWETYDAEVCASCSEGTLALWYANYSFGSSPQYVKYTVDPEAGEFTLSCGSKNIARVPYDEAADGFHKLGISVGIGRIRCFFDGECIIDTKSTVSGWGKVPSPLLFRSSDTNAAAASVKTGDYGTIYDPSLTAAVPLTGDVDGDGAVTAADVYAAREYAVTGKTDIPASADLSGDGAFGSADIARLRRLVENY